MIVTDIPVNNAYTSSDIAFYQYKASQTNNPLYGCILRAARKFKVHPDYIYVIAKLENGKTGEYRRNESDGTHDVGKMQINYETWAREFTRLGFYVDWPRVIHNLCDNVDVGTKIIQLRQKSATNAITAMANYHWFASAKNNKPHMTYRARVTPAYRALIEEKIRFLEKQGKSDDVKY